MFTAWFLVRLPPFPLDSHLSLLLSTTLLHGVPEGIFLHPVLSLPPPLTHLPWLPSAPEQSPSSSAWPCAMAHQSPHVPLPPLPGWFPHPWYLLCDSHDHLGCSLSASISVDSLKSGSWSDSFGVPSITHHRRRHMEGPLFQMSESLALCIPRSRSA